MVLLDMYVNGKLLFNSFYWKYDIGQKKKKKQARYSTCGVMPRTTRKSEYYVTLVIRSTSVEKMCLKIDLQKNQLSIESKRKSKMRTFMASLVVPLLKLGHFQYFWS